MVSNRYLLLLLNRLLSQDYPESVITQFEDCQKAFDELLSNGYDFAIIDDSCETEELTTHLKILNEKRPLLSIVMLTDQKTRHQSLKAVHAGITAVFNYNDFQLEAISDLIRSLLITKKRSSRENYLGHILNKNGNNDIIDLTINTLAHEINNPLMTILGELELLLYNGYKLPPEIRKKLTIIEKSANRIKIGLTKLSELSEPSVNQTPTGDFIKID